MNFDNINFNEFQSIDKFYLFLDEHALKLYLNSDITSFILKCKNQIKSEDELEKVQWELEVSLFDFYGDTLFSFSYSSEENLKEFTKYPSIDKLHASGFNYLKQRTIDSNSCLLKAKYHHLLWKEHTTKNREHAKESIQNYIITIKSILNLKSYSSIGKLLEAIISLSIESKVFISEVKKLTQELINNSKIDFYIKHRIFKTMLKSNKFFKAYDFDNTLSHFKNYIKKSNTKIDDFFLVDEYLPTAIKISQKTNQDTKFWYNEIGYANLRMASKENQENRNWIKLGFYESAIRAFKSSNNSEKKSEAEQLYFELKPKIKLETFRVDFDDETIEKLKESQQELKDKAIKLLEEPPNKVYQKISHGVFFPKYDYIIKSSKQEGFEPAFLKASKSFQFDNNKNISRKNTDTEREKILKTYGNKISETLLPFFHYVIVLGLQSGHLSYKNMLLYFLNETWIGKPYSKRNLGGDIMEFNFINQIAPSIIEFCTQVVAWGQSEYYKPNFILCTDSLTLKIEGLFRNFSERINVSTSIGKQKGVQEVLLHDVMDNETIRSYFDKDDRLLFDYVLSNNDGSLNLRNNIAHCFYNEKEYHPDKMLLLLAVLFRLGKYDIQKVKSL